MIESRIPKRFPETKNTSYYSSYFALCFGKFDYVLELHPESHESAFEIMNDMRAELFKTGSSSVWSFLSVICFPLGMSRGKRGKPIHTSASPPIRSYSFFRTVGEVTQVLEAVNGLSGRFASVEKEVLWNPSLMSYVIKLSGSNVNPIFKYLISLRKSKKASSMRDLCTFFAVPRARLSSLKNFGVRGVVNIKLCDNELFREFIKLPSTEFRLGYFDLARSLERSSLQSFLKEIEKMRRRFRLNGPPDRAVTVLTFKDSKALGGADE